MPRITRKPNLQLRKIVLEETNDGRDIVRFLKNVIVHIQDGPKTFGIRPQDFARTHKIDAARILARLGLEEGKRHLRRTYVPTPFRRIHPEEEDGPKRDTTRATSDLYRLVRKKTNDGADIMLNFIEIMKGYHPEFKPHLRMAAAKELVRQIEFDYEDEEQPTPPTSEPPDASEPEPTGSEPVGASLVAAHDHEDESSTAPAPEPTQARPVSTDAAPIRAESTQEPAKREIREESTPEPATPSESTSNPQPTNPINPTNPASDQITAHHPNPTNHSSDHISETALQAYRDYATHNCAPESESIYHSIIRRAADQPSADSAKQEAERLITEFNQFIAKTDPEHPPVAVPDEIIVRELTQRPALPFDPGDYYDLDRDDFYFCQCGGCDQCAEFDFFIEFLIELEEETDHLFEDP